MRIDLDLGGGHSLRWISWAPDPALNPQYADLPPEEFHHGAIVSHPRPDNGEHCEGCITFDSPRARRMAGEHKFWTVEQQDPLTLSPSLLCTECGRHGFIREGQWIGA